MFAFAARSVFQHRATSLATAIIAVVGIALVSAMAALLDTGLADERPSEFLTVFPLIVGGWIVAIVVFAMVSTVAVALEARAGEFVGIRLIGAEPRQIRALVTIETALVAAVSTVPGLALGYVLGWGLCSLIGAVGPVGAAPAYAPGIPLPLLGGVAVFAAAMIAGFVSSRRAARGSVLGEGPAEHGARVSARTRRIAASVVLAVGVASALAALAFDAGSVLTTAMTGPACVLIAVGLSLLASEQTAIVKTVLARSSRRGSASRWLAARNLGAAPDRSRPLVTFLTLFVGIAAGTLSMQGIENASAGSAPDAQLIASINYLVVGLLATFMAVALVNNLIAMILRRRPEFGMMRLVGATPAQSRAVLLQEVLATASTSAVAGVAGALVAGIPYAIVKTGSAAAAFAPLPYLAVGVVGVGLAVVVSALTTARALRGMPA
ncbi:FtsX-like permease family protein [Agromyces sp. G08B096]|uniref:FtsX-like permease family protein n=1 Tax=Agromyces sp. G08B096 TaxID=3156399 RepID=A0AAU7W8Y8_9MICO